MKTPRCVAVALSDGLGNQMFQYAAARAVSLRANLPLKIDLDILQKGDGFRRYMLDGFALKAEFLSDDERRALLGRGATANTRRWIDRLRDELKPFHLRKGIIQKGWKFDRRLLCVRTPCHIRGYWLSEEYFSEFSDVIRADFAPRAPLEAKLSEVISGMKATESAALHVRRTDYLAPHTAGIHGVCPLEYYKSAVELIERKLNRVKWWIFSDDPDWVSGQEFFRNLGEVVRGDIRNPWSDFWMMSACRHFVIANSTFSWWAAWLGEKNGSLIVAPRRWFVDPQRNCDRIVPRRWLKI